MKQFCTHHLNLSFPTSPIGSLCPDWSNIYFHEFALYYFWPFLPEPLFGSGSLVVVSEQANRSDDHQWKDDDGTYDGDNDDFWRNWNELEYIAEFGLKSINPFKCSGF